MGVAKPQRVVVVDDEDRLLRILCPWLESLGYDARSFTSAAEALEFLAREHVDVVIAGTHLPGMGAAQLCASIRGVSGASPPRLVGLVRADETASAWEVGFDALVGRP